MANSKNPGQPAHMRRLAWGFTVCIGDMYAARANLYCVPVDIPDLNVKYLAYGILLLNHLSHAK